MLRALPLPLRHASTSQASSCACKRHAHLSNSLPGALSSTSLPPPPPSSSYAPIANPDIYSDPSYYSRYRNPALHDVPLSRPSYSRRRPPSIQAATREEYRKREQARETPRSRRLEMERLWSGGEASPPIPLESFRMRAEILKPKHALLFPGSGSQYVGMGHFLKEYKGAGRVWDEAQSVLAEWEDWVKTIGLEEMGGEVGELGRMMREREPERLKAKGLKDVVFDGPQDELTESWNAQPAILITSTAFLRTLESDFDSPVAKEASFFLGHSSGEYSAAVASGAISFADGVRLTRLHGLLTSYALDLPSINLSASPASSPPLRAQMSALVINAGHSHAEVAEVIASILGTSTHGMEGSVEVASYNSSAQVVLAGTREGILRANEVLTERGIASRAADLPVTAPFHCSFMKPAAEGMSLALSQLTLKSPTAPLLSGVDGTLITKPSSLISNLVAQISLPVRWSHCLDALRAHEVNRLVFLGPGKALANLARRDTRGEGEEREVMSVATDEDLGSVSTLWRD